MTSIIKPDQSQKLAITNDILTGLRQSVMPILIHIYHKYILVIIGSIITLMALYGINEIIKLTTIEFPASVCLMLLLFAILTLNSFLFGEKATEKYLLKYIEVPCGFALRWMNIYFTPPFVTLVLADKVSVGEAFTIAAVFVVGYLIGYAFIGYFVWGLQILLGTYNYDECGGTPFKWGKKKGATNDGGDGVDLEMGQVENSSNNNNDNDDNNDTNNYTNHDNDLSSQESNEYINEDGEIALKYINDCNEGLALEEMATNHKLSRTITRASANGTLHHHSHHNNHQNQELNSDKTEASINNQTISTASTTNSLKSQCNKSSQFIITWFDFLVYSIVFVIGIPIYFTTGYELPLQLSVAVLLFRCCMLFPANWRRYLHPILISFSVSLLVFYIFSLMKGQNFYAMIRHYKTGRTYLHLFDSKNYHRLPGAGDFLLSLMDISIVSLALAMYNYRYDLKRYFTSLIPPILMCSFMSFFIYPPVCYRLGISAERSLGFTGRSVTMALGTPLVSALDGSNQLMAVTTIISGILGVLCGDFLIFKVMKVRKNDFVTRGVTLGVNCGAVSTAHLLTVDARAAAMSSLSFTLFGTVMVILAAIRPVVHVIQGLVGW